MIHDWGNVEAHDLEARRAEVLKSTSLVSQTLHAGWYALLGALLVALMAKLPILTALLYALTAAAVVLICAVLVMSIDAEKRAQRHYIVDQLAQKRRETIAARRKLEAGEAVTEEDIRRL